MVEQLKSTGPVLAVDAGHLFLREHTLPDSERADREAKARLIAKATALGGIDAMLPGQGDIQFGRAFIEAVAKEYALPYVVSNANCDSPLPWPTKLEFDRGGVRIEVYGQWSGSAPLPGCRVFDSPEGLEGSVPSDTVVIVLADQSDRQVAELTERFPAIDLIVRSDAQKPLGTPAVMPNGGLLLSSGGKGKTLGILAVNVQPGATGWRDEAAVAEKATAKDNAAERLAEIERRLAAAADEKEQARLTKQLTFWKEKYEKASAEVESAVAAAGPSNLVRNELRGLGDGIGEHAPTYALVAAFKGEQTLTPPVLPVDAPPTLPAAESPFVGGAACAACHPAQAEQWKTTAHATAWASLVEVSRPFDADCWRCHVTGGFTPGGPTDPRALGGLENVQCEACHGAGRAHAANPAAGGIVANPPVSQCTQCHDKTQDDGRFDEAIYRPKVVH